jgi:formylglycine-generating enzyme required for sulfatase activity
VRLAEILMGQSPITQAQWRVVAQWREREGERWGRELNPNPSYFQPKRESASDRGEVYGSFSLLDGEETTDQRPVECVSWGDAVEFCSRLSQRTGRFYTLPAEAQWEYACRAGTATPFAFGATITSDLANYHGSIGYASGLKGKDWQQTTPVGMFPANAWGLQDMHGNVWEWCLDYWHESYQGAPGDGSAWQAMDGNAGEASRVVRGGARNSHPGSCRSASRLPSLHNLVSGLVGFRVVCLPSRLCT